MTNVVKFNLKYTICDILLRKLRQTKQDNNLE